MNAPDPLFPMVIVADYVPELRLALSQFFPQTQVYGSMIHRSRLLLNLSKNVKCPIMGIKTGAIARQTYLFVSYLLVLAMLPPQQSLNLYGRLSEVMDITPFTQVLQEYNKLFIEEGAPYIIELTFFSFINQKYFKVATPAIEGYHYRIRELMKTFSVSNIETLVEKILKVEEPHFSSKVTEVILGRIIAPELPEKFFFERIMGSLPISTMVADIYGTLELFEPFQIAQMLVEQSETLQLPQRRSLVSLCDLEEYKNSLIQQSAFHPEIIKNHTQRARNYKALRKTEVKEEEEVAN